MKKMPNDGVCRIVGGGAFSAAAFVPKANDYLIAADRGFALLTQAGFQPDLVVGDFDSLGYRPDFPNILYHPPEKDDTDMLMAVRAGLRQGYRRFVLYGALGGARIDHTFANVQTLLFLLAHGATGYLTDGNTVVTCLKNGTMDFPAEMSGYLSLFSLRRCSAGVTLHGLKYPLADAALKSAYPLGVSNEFTGAAARVHVARGTLLLVFSDPLRIVLP